MDFNFSEEEQLFKASVREFCDANVAPYFMQRAQVKGFDSKLNAQYAEQGWLGLGTPSKFGGCMDECSAVMLGILHEEIGRADSGAWVKIGGATVLGRVLSTVGSETVQEMWLPGLVKGEKTIGGCFTEPEGGTDAATVRVTAVQEGNHYIINGEKTSISEAIDADVFLVSTQTTPGARQHGVSLFMVPKDAPGVEVSLLDDIGMRPIARGIVKFTDVRVPAEYMVGERDRGLYSVMGVFDIARTGIGIACVGSAMKALEDAAEWAKQRMLFGKKLSQLQTIGYTFAEMHTKLEAALMLGYRSYWMRDQGISNTKESCQIKWYGVQTAMEALHFSMRLYGHLGYTSEFDAAQRWIDCQSYEYGDGVPEAQKLVIARKYLGRENAPEC